MPGGCGTGRQASRRPHVWDCWQAQACLTLPRGSAPPPALSRFWSLRVPWPGRNLPRAPLPGCAAHTPRPGRPQTLRAAPPPWPGVREPTGPEQLLAVLPAPPQPRPGGLGATGWDGAASRAPTQPLLGLGRPVPASGWGHPCTETPPPGSPASPTHPRPPWRVGSGRTAGPPAAASSRAETDERQVPTVCQGPAGTRDAHTGGRPGSPGLGRGGPAEDGPQVPPSGHEKPTSSVSVLLPGARDRPEPIRQEQEAELRGWAGAEASEETAGQEASSGAGRLPLGDMQAFWQNGVHLSPCLRSKKAK